MTGFTILNFFSLLYSKENEFDYKHSTIHSLVELLEKLRMKKRKNTLSFFLDLKKSFDTSNILIRC